MAEALEWLAGVHGQLVSDVGALADDGELDRLRPTNWARSG